MPGGRPKSRVRPDAVKSVAKVLDIELDQEFAVRFLFEGGKIVRIDGFRTWQEALEAAGLSE